MRVVVAAMNLAPMHLERLLEIWCSRAPVSCPHLMRSTGNCTPLSDMKMWGLIEQENVATDGDHGWRVTDKGAAYVEAMLSLPEPVQKWVMP